MTGTLSAAEADRACREITYQQARNFRWGIQLLPPAKRHALSAVYAMARRIDDIGDGPLPPEQKLAGLERTRRVVADPGAVPDDPVAAALARSAAAFGLPLSAFDDLITGCEQDVRGHRYSTIDDLVHYCRLVAGSIGRLSLAVFAPAVDERTRRRCESWADDLGVALQLTNVLRDVREDLGTGRVYLPADDLARFGCAVRFDGDGDLDPCDGALVDLIRFEAARAWGWYDRGLRLVPLLDRRSGACCAAIAGVYLELLQRIVRRPEEVLRTRASVPGRAKARIASRAILRPWAVGGG